MIWKKYNYHKIIEPIIILLVLIDVALLLTTTFYPISTHLENIIIDFDFAVCIILLIEFFTLLYKADNRKDFLKHNWLNLVAAIPIDFFLLRIFRFVRVFEILDLLRVGKVFLLSKEDIGRFTDFIKSRNLDKMLAAVIFTILLSSVLLMIFDPKTPTLFTSFWYVIVTLSTVGYGDVVPSTHIGKIIAILLITVGICVFSVFTAAIGSIYTNKIQSDSDDKTEQQINELKQQVKDDDHVEDEIRELRLQVEQLTLAIEKLQNEEK